MTESWARLVFNCEEGYRPRVQSKDRRSGRERSDGDWTEGENRTTRGSLAVQSGSPEAAVRGGVSAALDLEVRHQPEGVCASIAVTQKRDQMMAP